MSDPWARRLKIAAIVVLALVAAYGLYLFVCNMDPDVVNAAFDLALTGTILALAAASVVRLARAAASLRSRGTTDAAPTDADGTTTEGRPKRPSTLGRDLVFLGVALVFLLSLRTVGIAWHRVLCDLPADLVRIFGQMFLPPDWSALPFAIEQMIITIAIAWIGTLIGAALSLPIGFLAANNVSGGTVSALARLLLDAIRAVPELVLALIVFIPLVGLGPPAGALAIGIHSIGTLGKLTSEAVESIDPGPVEAARAVGGSNLAVQRWGVLPQVLPEIVAFWLYRFEINVRAAGVLGLVGAGGIGAMLANALTYRRWEVAGMAVIVIVVATILIDMASGWVRRRIIEGAEGKSDDGGGADESLERLDTWSGAASGAMANVEPNPNDPATDRAPV